jgi:hypothetical protein
VVTYCESQIDFGNMRLRQQTLKLSFAVFKNHLSQSWSNFTLANNSLPSSHLSAGGLRVGYLQ